MRAALRLPDGRLAIGEADSEATFNDLVNASSTFSASRSSTSILLLPASLAPVKCLGTAYAPGSLTIPASPETVVSSRSTEFAPICPSVRWQSPGTVGTPLS